MTKADIFKNFCKSGVITLSAGVVLLAVFAPPTHAQDSGKNTLEKIKRDIIEIDGQRIRLYGIDALEMKRICASRKGINHGCGDYVKKYMASMITGFPLKCEFENRGKQKDLIAVCHLDIEGISKKMGFALQPRRAQHIAPLKAVADFAPHPRKPIPPMLSYRDTDALASVDKVALVRQRPAPEHNVMPTGKRAGRSQKFYEYASSYDGANLPFDKNKISSPGGTRPTVDGCPPFPRVPWWKNNTHEKVVRYVDSEYYGDWSVYISKWESHLANVVGVVAERKKMLIRGAGVIISGEGFIDYVQKIKQRISVMRCISHKEMIKQKVPGVLGQKFVSSNF